VAEDAVAAVSRFAVVAPREIAALIATHPFAWIVAPNALSAATPMPLLAEADADGGPAALIGHLPKRHPLVAALRADPRGLFLFQGPHDYISPEWLSNKDWAPTWNFAVAMITGDVAFDEALTERALIDLVAHMERERHVPWTVSAMGERFHRLRDQVIGFRVTIRDVRARFKLGQDESDTAFGEILAGLGAGELSDWMRRAR
jgi:transcriptional regulator